MTEEDPKPGVVIDVTPDQDSDDGPAMAADSGEQAKSDEAAATAPRTRNLGGIAMLLGVAALLAVVAAGAFGYRHWSGLSDEVSAMDTRVREAVQ